MLYVFKLFLNNDKNNDKFIDKFIDKIFACLKRKALR